MGDVEGRGAGGKGGAKKRARGEERGQRGRMECGAANVGERDFGGSGSECAM